MKKLLKWLLIVFIALIVIGAVLGPSDNDKKKPETTALDSNPVATSAPIPAVETAPQDTAVKASTDKPDVSDNFTAQQRNAIRSAEQYLMVQAFSRKGLIRQLSSDAGEGYSLNDATVAVDSLTVDWNQEAVKSAKQYLEMQGFSCKGLIQQLSSSAGDGYTQSQARYGATQAGAC